MLKFPKYKYILALYDFCALYLSLVTSLIVADYFGKINYGELNNIFGLLAILFFLTAFIGIIFFQSNNLYKINIFLSLSSQIISIIKSITYVGISYIILSFLFKINIVLDSRFAFFLFIIISLITVVILRVAIARPIYLLLTHNKIIKRKVVIIGAGRLGKLLATKLILEEKNGTEVIGFIDDNVGTGKMVISHIKVIGSVDDISHLKNQYRIDEIIVAIDNISYERLLQILDICHENNLYAKLVSELFDVVARKLVTEKYSDLSVINLTQQIHSGITLFFKRVVDFILSVTGLIILSPFLLILGILIRISSPGPILFTHLRIGKDGKPFLFYKFRSMKIAVDGDKEREKMMIDFMKKGKNQYKGDTKIISQNRITWIGKFIRATSLDELPQLLNVIKGEMSLVGPRPCLPYEFENYDDWQKRRLSVLPGCTGVWQVNGRSNVSFNDSVVLDLYYINNMSPWLDLQLMLKTIPVMIFVRGGK